MVKDRTEEAFMERLNRRDLIGKDPAGESFAVYRGEVIIRMKANF